MGAHFRYPVSSGTVNVWCSDASDGDFGVANPTPGLEQRREAIVAAPWSWLRQVHGSDIYTIDRPGQSAGQEGDGMVTRQSGCPLSVTTADCAPVVLIADNAVAVVHAGWRGLAAGIVAAAADRISQVGGGTPIASHLGPCIHPESYEFGEQELAVVEGHLGRGLSATTSTGDLAFDVPKAVERAVVGAGFPKPAESVCTSGLEWYSHRVRADTARLATVAWIEGP